MRAGRLCYSTVSIAVLVMATTANADDKIKHLKYTVTEIPTPEVAECVSGMNRFTSFRRLNENGQAVGNTFCFIATDNPEEPHSSTNSAHEWSVATGLIALPAPSPNALQTLARDINELGVIVGQEYSLDGARTPVWFPGGGVSYAYEASGCVPGNVSSRGEVINDLGTVASWDLRRRFPGDNCTTRWLFKLATGEEIYGPVGVMRDLNNLDVGVGGSGSAAVRWSPTGGEVVLSRIVAGVPGRPIAYGINDLNETVGAHNVSDATGCLASADAKRWAADGTESTLPSLPGKPINAAFQINAAGDVAGWAQSESGCEQNDPAKWLAVIWHDGEIADLNDLIPSAVARDFQLTNAADINDRGQVLVRGIRRGEPKAPCPVTEFDPVTGESYYNASKVCHNEYSFLLTPKP